jgi:hypothetical protein
VYVFQDLPVKAGDHAVSVRFSALVPAGFDPEGRVVSFTWAGNMSLGPRQIGLITMDPTHTALVRHQR